MDPDSPATKRRRVEDTVHVSTSSVDFQHQGQHHNLNAKTHAKTDFEPPSTSGTSSGDFQLYTAPSSNPTITISSPIRFEDFLTKTAGETPRQEGFEQPEPEPNDKKKPEEDVSVRERHNNIGRRYRNKLNEQFENLQVLLSEQNTDQLDGEDECGNRESQESGDNNNSTAMDSSSLPTRVRKGRRGRRGINKASLLEMAKVRIETLTEEKEGLIAEVQQLEKELAGENKTRTGEDHEIY